jgi:hypothetical protein
MNRNARISCFLGFTLAVLSGCSSGPSASESKKAAPLDRIQGKAQVLIETGISAADAALNAGGPTVYIWVGAHRYRLFMTKPADIVHGDQYVVEGIDAQKAIDKIGDPDNGKNGYPLQASCTQVVQMAWKDLAFDAVDAQAGVLRTRVQRYPARTVFLVASVRPATDADKSTATADSNAAADDKAKEVAVPAEKQKALLIEGPTVQTAPLWDSAGETVHCKVVIGTDGKIADLDTGAQLCEAVPWGQFKYQPPVQAGKPVKVSTEVEIRFDARK